MQNKFYTKAGWLTPYAMACGYQHITEAGPYHVVFEENNLELNTYQVRTFNRDAWEQNRWYVVEGIEAARSLYRQCCYLAPDKRYEAATDIQREVFA